MRRSRRSPSGSWTSASSRATRSRSSRTRVPEWTEACFGILTAGGTLVTIYQTNSPEECQYVLEHSDSRAIFAEDAEQLAKVREVEDKCPELEHVIVMDPSGAELGDALIAGAAARARPRP